MISKVLSGGLSGIEGFLVDVEVDMQQGLPSFDIVGLPDSAVRESKERVTSAIRNTTNTPILKRTTVNLAPANMRKEGPVFDLPIAVGILNCLQILPENVHKGIFITGELSLDGSIRPVNGILPMVYHAFQKGIKKFIVPFENSNEAALVSQAEVVGVKSLQELIDHFTNKPLPRVHVDVDAFFARGALRQSALDYGDVKGQKAVKRALEIAAAGNHNILMIGPPGSGKTMLAKRLPGILPDLSFHESMSVTMIYSVSGYLKNKHCLVVRRPFRAPHHTVSYAALTGGGRIPKPGEISLAHKGVLFLDELPEFNKHSLEVLRQPMEDRQITVSRANATLVYPAEFLLMASMNPCPCGYYGEGNKCTCQQHQIARYQAKISGPLLDRIDIQVEVPAVKYSELSGKDESSETSEQIKARVVKCRDLQSQRYKDLDFTCNSQLDAANIEKFCPLGDTEKNLLQKAFDTLNLSARAYHKILKIARTIADLDNSENITAVHLGEAIHYRTLDRKFWY